VLATGPPEAAGRAEIGGGRLWVMPSTLSPPPFGLAPLAPQGAQLGIALRGELDLAAVPALRAELDRVVEAGPARLVVDLSQLSFVDASGVAALLAARDQLGRQGGELTTVCPDPHVRRTFALTGTEAALGVAAEAACGSRSGPTPSSTGRRSRTSPR